MMIRVLPKVPKFDMLIRESRWLLYEKKEIELSKFI